MARPRMRLVHLVGLALGVAAFAWLASRAGLAEALASARAVGPRLVLLIVPYAVATALYAIPWGLLVPRAHRPRWSAVVATRFAAAAVNVLLPTGFFGEPVRLRAVAPAGRAEASEALVWDRALYLGASGAFLALAAIGGQAAGGAAYAGAALVAMAGYFAGGASLVGVTRIGALRRWLSQRLGRFFPQLRASPPVLRPSWPKATGSLALHLVARLSVAAEIWLGARLLGVHLTFVAWLFAAGATALSAAAMPIVPGQIGVQEAALTGALAAMGVEPSTGLALGLLLRARQMLFVPIGLLLGTSRATQASGPAAVSAPPAPEASPASSRGAGTRRG